MLGGWGLICLMSIRRGLIINESGKGREMGDKHVLLSDEMRAM